MAFYSGAYMGKLLRVNLTKKATTEEIIPDEFFRQFLGGRGVAAKYYYDEIGSDVDPLSSENKILLMSGPLTGLNLPAATKFQLSTKSPETGHYLCSNCSGRLGAHLKRSGFDGMIIEGAADSWTTITILDGAVEFKDASALTGKTTGETLEVLYADVGNDRAGALTIGPAAEKLVRISYVNVDTRAFGRGGAGSGFRLQEAEGSGCPGHRVHSGRGPGGCRRHSHRSDKRTEGVPGQSYQIRYGPVCSADKRTGLYADPQFSDHLF